jgi:hypothetical protein
VRVLKNIFSFSEENKEKSSLSETYIAEDNKCMPDSSYVGPSGARVTKDTGSGADRNSPSIYFKIGVLVVGNISILLHAQATNSLSIFSHEPQVSTQC